MKLSYDLEEYTVGTRPCIWFDYDDPSCGCTICVNWKTLLEHYKNVPDDGTHREDRY